MEMVNSSNNHMIRLVFASFLILSLLITLSFSIVHAEQSSFNLMFFLPIDSPRYSQDLKLFAQNLKSGDYIFIHDSAIDLPTVFQRVQEAKGMVKPGANVDASIMYVSIATLTSEVQTLPKGLDYVIYDYEKGAGFSPEFTTNETVSIGYFDQAAAAVKQYNAKTGSNAKLLVTPPYGELRNANWDWGLAAKHMDAIDIQFGGFTNDPNLFKYVPPVVAQVKQESPNTFVFIQLSLFPTKSTPQITANDIYTLQKYGVNNFLPFYDRASPTQDSILQQFFSVLPRSLPEPPTNLSANPVSSSQINLSWVTPNNSSAITGHKIERSVDSSSSWSTVVSNTASASTKYSDTGLTPNTTYTYRVSAINSVGTSVPSNTASATTPTATITLTVKSVDRLGNPTTGVLTVIQHNGMIQAIGPTPLIYKATSGTTYTVTVSNYLNFVFTHWSNGSTNPHRIITPIVDTTLTAHYHIS